MIKVTGIPAAQKRLLKSKRDFDKRVAKKVHLAAQYVHISITSLTAVWEGTSLANWQWSIGKAKLNTITARGRMEPGATNSMALGAEPRRAANQALADQSFRSISFKDPYQKFILSNNDPKIGLMEAGKTPTPARSRTENMVKITKTGVLDYLRNLKV